MTDTNRRQPVIINSNFNENNRKIHTKNTWAVCIANSQCFWCVWSVGGLLFRKSVRAIWMRHKREKKWHFLSHCVLCVFYTYFIFRSILLMMNSMRIHLLANRINWFSLRIRLGQLMRRCQYEYCARRIIGIFRLIFWENGRPIINENEVSKLSSNTMNIMIN